MAAYDKGSANTFILFFCLLVISIHFSTALISPSNAASLNFDILS
jgi:hypothetical protein